MFERIRVPADLVVDAGIRRVTDREARTARLVGRGDLSGLLFPYADLQSGRMETCRNDRTAPHSARVAVGGRTIEAMYRGMEIRDFDDRLARLEQSLAQSEEEGKL